MLDEKAYYNHTIVIDRPFVRYRIFLSRFKNKEIVVDKNIQIVCVVKGSINLKFNKKVISLKKDDLYIINSNKCYEFIETEEENTLMVLQVKKSYLTEYLDLDENVNFTSDITSDDKNKIIRLLGELYLMGFNYQWDSADTDIKVNEILNLLKKKNAVENKDNNNRSVENIVYDIARYIANSYLEISNNDIKLSDITDDFNINYYYLSRYFKRVIGLSFTDYLLRFKINHAADLLVNTDKKILDISIESGFSNVKSFNLGFRKYFNTTPSKFRNKFKNINKKILESNIYREEETQKFLEKATSDKIKYFREDINEQFNIDFKSTSLLDRKNKNSIIDLNNVINIDSGFANIDVALKNFYTDNIIIHIYLDRENVYLVDKNRELIELNKFEYNYLINILKENKYNVMLVLNCEVPNSSKKLNSEFDKKFISNLEFNLNLISSIIGYKNLKKYIFGVNIYNIKELVQNGNIDLVREQIELFNKIFEDKFGKDNYKWCLYLNDINNFEDTQYIKVIADNIKKADEYIVEYNYDHISVDYAKASDYFINITNEINNILSLGIKQELVVGFNYDITNVHLKEEYRINYARLFTLYLYLKFVRNGYRVAFTQYELSREDSLVKYEKYSHNELGIRNNDYYIMSFVNALGTELLEIENGMFVTRDDKDLIILLYDNYKDYYKYTNENLSIDYDKEVNYKIDISNLNGIYKIIEYNIDCYDRSLNLNSEYIISISDEEKLYLGGKTMPTLDIKFEEIKNKYTYEISRRILDIKLIKFQKI